MTLGISVQTVFDVTQTILQVNPVLNHLSNNVLSLLSVLKVSLVLVCLLVLDTIQDAFIQYQLVRFCQHTRLQCTNSHFLFHNRCVLSQQHVDCKITDTLPKKGTKKHSDGYGVTSNDITSCVLYYYITFCGLTWFFSRGNVRTCGYLRMIFGTRPHCHRPRSCSSVTSTPRFFPTIGHY